MVEVAGQTEGAELDPLQEAYSRNLPVELHFADKDDQLIVLKSRVLGLNEETLELDMPQSIGQEIHFRPGQRFDCHFVAFGEVYSCRTRIAQLRQVIELNTKRRVVGIVVKRPKKVEPGQRRNDHRVRVIDARTAGTFNRVVMEGSQALCPIGDTREEIELVDLSAGGLSFTIPRRSGLNLRANHFIFVDLVLNEKEVLPPALLEIRQVRELPRRAGFRIGCQLQVWPTRTSTQRWRQNVQRFLTELQREQLRKRDDD